jgi:threonine/homoserine/homoserine lactone efflux protein
MISNFFLGFVWSFIGSIPPGAINLIAIKISGVDGNRKGALWFAFGAVLPEGIYSSIAFIFAEYLMKQEGLERILLAVSAPVLIGLGILYWFSKPKEKTEGKTGKPAALFAQGLVLGILNPLNIPYWLTYNMVFFGNEWLHAGDLPMVFYITGILLGTFGLLYLAIWFAPTFTKLVKTSGQTINRALAIILTVMGLWQAVQWIRLG